MNEVETKILDVDAEEIKDKLTNLGAKKIRDTRLVVDWFRPKGDKEGQTPWFLRIRTNGEGSSEATWKSNRTFLGASSSHSEESIQEAIKLLKLEDKVATPEGERDVISKNYGLDWHDMRF